MHRHGSLHLLKHQSGDYLEFVSHGCVWTQADSGIGRGIDSFYEYMLKAHVLLGGESYLAIFHDAYYAALRHLKHGSWYIDAHTLTTQVPLLSDREPRCNAHRH